MALSPDVLSLLIGVNNTIREMVGEGSASVSAFENEYRSLLNRMLAKNPECLLILMEPFLLRAGSVNEAWIQHLQDRQKVVRHLAEEFGALFVPCQSAMDAVLHRAPAEEWAYDGIHPTHAGAAVLAEAWDTVAGIAVKACLE
jgi:lysophospholipase L1-like esterase